MSIVAAAALTGISSFADTSATTTSSTVVESSAMATSSATKATPPKTKKHQAAKKQSYSDAHYRHLEREVHALQQQVSMLRTGEPREVGNPNNVIYAHGPAVVSSPYVNLEYGADYGGSDLLINLPSINKDQWLLQLRKQIYDCYCKYGFEGPNRPLVALSGKIGVDAMEQKDFDKHNKSDIDLDSAELEAVAEVNPWVTGLVKLKYSTLENDTGSNADNNKFTVSEAFITIGNLDKTNLYTSFGQMYIPFTFDNSLTVTDTLVNTIGKTKEQPLIVGFTDYYGFYGSLYAFKGETYVSNPNIVNNWGADVGYRKAHDKSYIDAGVAYMDNLADSLGMQSTPNAAETTPENNFSGFGDGYKLMERVHAVDGHFLLGLGETPKWSMYNPWTFIAEYVGATGTFDENDMMFDGSGAKPQAVDFQAGYNFLAFDKPSFVAIGYDHSWDALALNLPQQSYFLTVGANFFKDTLARLEYRHDVNYDSSDYASAGGESVFNAGSSDRDTITANFEIYF
jgi:hypothetical protein